MACDKIISLADAAWSLDSSQMANERSAENVVCHEDLLIVLGILR